MERGPYAGELCQPCADAQGEPTHDGDDTPEVYVSEGCRHCGGALDAFGQCWSCDTYGTPAEQAAERGEGSPCCPKCENCGRALDECGCFGGDQ